MRKLLLLMCCMLTTALWGQDRTVSGRITSQEDGTSLPGVNILIKNSLVGTISDAEGNYKLTVPSQATHLVFSFIGLQTKEVAINDQTTIDVQLQSDVTQLSEVVISGLASNVKRSNLANAVASVSANELVGITRPATLDGAMSGKIVGANITQNSGAPGGGMSIKLRGISSINGSSEPLFIVDGVFINNSQFQTGAGTGAFSGAALGATGSQDQSTNRLADINPADIETVEILKGPSAAAIYGTRANAGVVIITTKKGKAGKTKISFGQDVGFSQAIKLLGSSDWSVDKITQYDGIYNTSLADALALFSEAGGKKYDYEKEVYGNIGQIFNSRLSVSGGDEKTSFLISGGLTDETGIQKRTGFERNSIRVNLNHKLSALADFSIGSNYVNSNNQRGFSGNDNNGVSLGYSLAYLPNFINQDKNADGTYPENPVTGQNPLQIVDKAVNEETTNRFIQSINLNLNLIRKNNLSLKFALTGGVDYLNTESFVYIPDDLQYQQQRANPGASRLTDSRNLNTNVQGMMVLNAFIKKVDLTTQAGVVRLETNREITFVQGEGLAPKQFNPNTGAVRTLLHTLQGWQDVGLVFQQEANWQDKVIGNVGIRWDKSSLNGDHEKWYPFPRASLAVNVANFDFWSFKPVNQLKLRGAFGQTGGVPNFGETFTSLVNVNIGDRLGALSPTVNGNPIIEPETAQEIEVGLDVGLFESKIGLEATYYQKDVFDLIQAFVLSAGTGVTSISAFPVGDLRNTGIEIALNAAPVQTSKVKWNTQLSYWTNESEITRLVIPATNVGTGFGAFGRNRLVLGQSPTRWFGTPNNSNAQPTGYGDAQPDFQLSWSNQINFLQNFDFSFLVHTSQGNYNSNLTTLLKDEGGTSIDWSDDQDRDGTPNGLDERFLGSPGNNTSFYIQDASYIRLREVSLYYRLPSKLLGKAFNNVMEGMRVGVSAQNLITITDYEGYDPEVSNFGNQSVGAAVDVAAFPNSRRLFFHLTFDF